MLVQGSARESFFNGKGKQEAVVSEQEMDDDQSLLWDSHLEMRSMWEARVRLGSSCTHTLRRGPTAGNAARILLDHGPYAVRPQSSHQAIASSWCRHALRFATSSTMQSTVSTLTTTS
ncbi:hypothetical protein PMIN06_000878 [Paraphaeosphaeria minitans]